MVSQCLELFKLFYEKYLQTSFSLDHVTIGESCGSEKLSFHIMIYDGKYAWNTGLANEPPYNSNQQTFITLMRDDFEQSGKVGLSYILTKRWSN